MLRRYKRASAEERARSFRVSGSRCSVLAELPVHLRRYRYTRNDAPSDSDEISNSPEAPFAADAFFSPATTPIRWQLIDKRYRSACHPARRESIFTRSCPSQTRFDVGYTLMMSDDACDFTLEKCELSLRSILYYANYTVVALQLEIAYV